ncbi:MAG TPA: hypothetical protein VJ833_13785 [Rhodanobacteraceae bacterium]|nr:hypothetical protein [Rhodanobacteraceae bacterium]
MQRTLVMAAAIAAGMGLATAAVAQSAPAPSTTATARSHNAASETGRDVDQQKRIEQGLQSGQLTSGEARKLEAGEAHIDRTEQRDLRNGTLSAAERTQIQRQQNRESKAIYNQNHDAQTGHPDSLKSNMEQANVQRNINQERRLHNGVKNGSLTNRELSRAEGGEAHTDRMESRRDTLRQTGRVQRADNRDSRRIHRAKHNTRARH